MSTPKLISPMLDGFSVGEAIRSHNGVCCYPAMKNDQDERYIVKIISIPPTQVQLEALLLSGAYATQEDALRYFEELARDILQEVRIIGELGNLEGFMPYLDAQTVKKEDGTGYEVYLLSPYRYPLSQHMEESVMTHKGIMDLAMDLCAALAACRRAGYLYIDLKPGNIFFSELHGFQISDLGFLPLASLKYASLPEKYHSIYTAPEITDAVSQLNTTLDVYALGLVLYQAYNGGTLPMDGDALVQPLLPPVYADYEMAEIILKACHPDPQARWQDPAALAQALAQYRQRNPVSDEPIVPAAVITPELDAGEDFLPEEDAMDEGDWEDIPELAFLDNLEQEVPGDVASDEVIEEGEDDTAQILAQADELIAHTLPDPVVAPEAVPIPTVEPEEPEETLEEDPQETATEELQPAAEAPAQAVEIPANQKPPNEKKPAPLWILPVAALVLVVVLVLGGWMYYQNVYLQHIDSITVTGFKDTVTVQLDTDMDEKLLRVCCSDTYGNTYYSDVVDGAAHFTGLAPQTRYTIRVLVEGFHKLTGNTQHTYTTPNQTTILDFSASIGPVDGSVYLSFTVSGTESDEWMISYHADGAEPQTITFTGHSVTVYDLVIGLDYTFTLAAADENLTGNTVVNFTARNIVRAENPKITDCGNGSLTVEWNTPAGETVTTWTVRCYDGSGYDQTVTTGDNQYTFTGLTHETACTIEITADGMNQCVTTQVGANPIRVNSFTHSITELYGVQISWEFTGTQPEGGWVLLWSCDGSPAESVEAAQNSAYIPWIPGGSYTVSVTSADGTNVFGSGYSFTLDEAEEFNGFGLTMRNLQFMMCCVPQAENWIWSDVREDEYKNRFTLAENAAFVIWSDTDVEAYTEVLQIKYVLRDSEGNLLNVSSATADWSTLWADNYCTLTLPYIPAEPGDFTLWIYFNGQVAHIQAFSMQ